jgi:hypothetical protein
VLGVDEDDPASEHYKFIEKNVPFVKIVQLQNNGKFIGLSTMWNTMADCIESDIYAMIGDDMAFMTPGWDEEIINEFSTDNCPPDKIKMLHCNDGHRGPGNKYPTVAPLCVNFFIHKNYIKTTGYFVEPYLENTHHDTWLQIVFDNLKRTKYRHDILIRHLHFGSTTGKKDAVSDNLEKLRENIWDNTDFVITHKKELSEEINKLRNFITSNEN